MIGHKKARPPKAPGTTLHVPISPVTPFFVARQGARTTKRPPVRGGPLARGAQPSDHWIPRDRYEPISRAILLDMPDRREREVEADNRHALGRCHVIDLMAGLGGDDRVDVEHHMPIRIAQEQFRYVG